MASMSSIEETVALPIGLEKRLARSRAGGWASGNVISAPSLSQLALGKRITRGAAVIHARDDTLLAVDPVADFLDFPSGQVAGRAKSDWRRCMALSDQLHPGAAGETDDSKNGGKACQTLRREGSGVIG